MDILTLIQSRRGVRKYKKNPLPEEVINKIVEAGRWGPSIHHLQPWKFVIIENKNLIFNILKEVKKKLNSINMPNFLNLPTITTLSNARVIICIYNTKLFSNFMRKFFKNNISVAITTEISSISAAIQNMVLTAESFGVGSCWLSSPLFSEKEINKILNMKDELIAILALGYPDARGKRSLRKSIKETVKILK